MGFIQNAKDTIARWLGITPVQRQVEIQVRSDSTKELTTFKNQLWYRGDPVELEQFYKGLAQMSLDGISRIPATRFWAATPVDDTLIRKFHSGIPRLIADKLAAIVVDDMNDPEMEGGVLQRWEEIASDAEFDMTVKEAVTKTLSEGDGAFKICVDPELSEYPLIEFYAGNNVEFKYKRGKLQEVLFYTDYFDDQNKRYRLVEYYGRGYVRYELQDSLGNTVDLELLEETEGLKDVQFQGDFIMAVPLKFYNSAKWANRGESIYETKSDIFDALDETLSTWLDAIRAGRVKQYIPEALIPRDPDTGHLRRPNVFNNYVVKNTDLSEEADNKIEVVQGKIEYEGLLGSYMTLLDCALQGLISPSTLGIDVKKLDNAEAQREKEKTTLYTRDTIIGVLLKVLPELVDVVLKTQDTMAKRMPPKEKYEATFEWGQYANPSFEAMVETVTKAKQGGIMSIERCVEELYGDTLTDEEKKKEIALLKAEQNPPLQVDEPGLSNDMNTDDEGGEGEPVGGEDGGSIV